MAAEVAQHTLSSLHGDFLFANIYLFVQKNSRLFSFLHLLFWIFFNSYLNEFFIKGYFIIFDPSVGDII